MDDWYQNVEFAMGLYDSAIEKALAIKVWLNNGMDLYPEHRKYLEQRLKYYEPKAIAEGIIGFFKLVI